MEFPPPPPPKSLCANRKLNLQGLGLKDNDLRNFFRKYKIPKDIQVIDLKNNKLTDNVFPFLLARINNDFDGLKELDLSRNHMSPEYLKKIQKFLFERFKSTLVH